jgi:hypothetical protein
LQSCRFDSDLRHQENQGLGRLAGPSFFIAADHPRAAIAQGDKIEAHVDDQLRVGDKWLPFFKMGK